MSRESIFISTSLFLTSRIVLLTLIISWICIHTNGNRNPPFQILAILPQEQAPQISRELRRALAEWEVSKHSSQVGSVNSVPGISISDIALFVSPMPVSNDTQRILSSLCDALEIHNPSIVLSLLDRPRNFYAAMIAESASLPFISLTQEYRQESSLQRISDTSMQISLDAPIWSLADAVFEMLRIQNWFDAILLIDDTVSSNLFSYRLSHLCRNTRDNKITRKVVSPNGPNNNIEYNNEITDVWKNLMIIQLSRVLVQREFYLRMAEIQTSHRRVIIVHCDRITTRRIIDTAKSLGLLDGHKIWVLLDGIIGSSEISSPSLWRYLNLPNGMIALRHRAQHVYDINTLSSIIQLVGQTAFSTYKNSRFWVNNDDIKNGSVPEVSCWHNLTATRRKYSETVFKELRKWLTPLSSLKSNVLCKLSKQYNQQQNSDTLYLPEEPIWSSPTFDILNLVPAVTGSYIKEWKVVGNITKDNATINSVRYIGDTSNEFHAFSSGKHRFRVATNIAPPFVIESTKLDNNTCLTGDFCLKIDTNVRDDLIAIFTDFRSQKREMEGVSYEVHCCAGIAIDLLNAVARDLNFEYDLYLVADGLFGVRRNGQWDGITADLVNDLAHLSFTAFSTTSTRVQAIDYSVPFFYSGVSCLSMSANYTDVPLEAFLIPFSIQLWVAIFASLIATAIAAAIYEWFSPFGLNPWGRQRTKNFSLASALWVMCSLLFSHLVAFKAPKSWPNKVLINVWGAFSVIFLATYTANIAAHFAGLFLIPEVNDFHDTSLMKQRTGTAKSSASEGYLMEKYTDLWHHIQKYKVHNFDEGLEHLRNDKLDVLIGDTAILDYFRATDPNCNLRLLGDSIFDDAYAVGMQKGFPLRELISSLILKYNEYGFLDQLHRKWYGRVHCLESSALTKPKPLTVRAVAGVFMMLCFGLIIGTLILLTEHFVFKYILPSLRKKPKDCFWKSPNLMFFSQKLYRFINTVELVSPHHSAKEIMSNLREGQIASLFQKSVKRKAKEEARRRKSKSQFFEMIQEVRKVVQRQHHERSFQEDSIEVITTKPSLPNKQDSIISETESLGATTSIRTSSIRFKEPEEIFDDEIFVHREPLPPHIVVKPTSSLKSTSSESRSKLLKSERTSTSATSSGEMTCYRSPLSPTIGSDARPLPQLGAQFTTSFSLENVSLSPTLNKKCYDRRKVLQKSKTWSYDDLAAIKKELNEPMSPSDRDHSSLMLFEFIPKKTPVIIPSPRHTSLIDNFRLSSMNKEDIMVMWRSSERELLNQLQDALQQKRALEEKVALLQRMLMKPP